MSRRRACTRMSGMTFCEGLCPFDEEFVDCRLHVVTRNGCPHLCDGTGELLHPTGEAPSDNVDASRVLLRLGRMVASIPDSARGR